MWPPRGPWPPFLMTPLHNSIAISKQKRLIANTTPMRPNLPNPNMYRPQGYPNRNPNLHNNILVRVRFWICIFLFLSVLNKWRRFQVNKYLSCSLDPGPNAKTKGTSSYHLCFEYFSQLFSIPDWFRNVYIISSCFERWCCNKTGQACNLEIILVKTGVRSVWFKDFWSLCKVNYPFIMSFIQL